MKENLNVIKKTGDRSRVYCHEDYAQDLYNLIITGKPIVKELRDGEIYRVVDFKLRNDGEIEALCENSMSLYFDISKERRYLKNIGIDEKTFIYYVHSGFDEILKDTELYIMVDDRKKLRGTLNGVHQISVRAEFKDQIIKQSKAYVAKIIEKNNGGFIVDMQGILAFLPGSLAAANKIIDFDEYLGREIYVMIEDYLEDTDIFIVSYKKYLEHILPVKLDELERHQYMTGVVTGCCRFGIFVEFDKIFTGLLHTSEMNDETSIRFKSRKIDSGEEISVWLKDIKDERLIFTEIDPSIKQKRLEQIKNDSEGELIKGTIISIKAYGALIELEEDIIGLLPVREMRKAKRRLIVGDILNIYVKKIDIETGKIHLSMSDPVLEKNNLE